MEDIFHSSKESLILGTEINNKSSTAEDGDESVPIKDDPAEEGLEAESSVINSKPGSPTPGPVISSNREAFSKFRAIITDYLNGEVAVRIPDGVAQDVLSSFSLAGYLDHAIPTGKDIVITKLMQQCCFQLQELLRVSDGICYVHEEQATAITQIIQMQLLNLYPKYSTQGYEALYSCPPTIYISPLCIPSLGSIICKKLGFPTSCIKVMKMTGKRLPKLEKSLVEDLAAKRVPVMIIASSGSHHSGQVDNLVTVSQLSKRFNAWLHLEGHLITHTGGLDDQPKKTLQVADSLHLDLKQLLGIPSLPYVTMYRHCEIALQRAACLTPSYCSPFNVVPLWFALQSFEIADISKRFQTAVDLCSVLLNHLLLLPNIKMMSYVPKIMKKSPSMESTKESSVSEDEPVRNNTPSAASENGTVAVESGIEAVEESSGEVDAGDTSGSGSFTEAITIGRRHSRTAFDDDDDDDDDDDNLGERTKPEALMNSVTPVVVFQYRPKCKGDDECSAGLLDDLNLWLIQVMERACHEIHMDIVDVDDSGYALRFSPYDCKSFPSSETLERFIDYLDQQLEILDATVLHKSTLIQIVDSSEELQLVELPGWAGLGGVRYLPSAWRSGNVEQLPDQGKEEINKINRELVARLKRTDSAFSVGEGKDGLACVRFGMVVAATDVNALAELVRQTGLDIEASTLALETMAVMVRKGIEEAQAELQRETEEQLWQEGLLRHIPVVGSLVNYFSPPQKAPVKGRTMNLRSGRIEKSDAVFLGQIGAGQPSVGQEEAVLEKTINSDPDEENLVEGVKEALAISQPAQ